MKVHRVLGAATVVAGIVLAAAPAAAAPAESFTEHNVVQFTDTGFINPCDGSPATLTVDGEEVFHVTDNGRTFRLSSTLRGTFTLDLAAPASDLAGHFVSLHNETVNYGQLKDYRVTDRIRSVSLSTDGSRVAVQTTMTVLFGADGSVEVKVDSARCGGQPV